MEERKKPFTGEIYRHFKQKLYQIIAIAINEATEEEMVVYQALYGDYGIYVRTLKNFMEPVDRLKYKEAQQNFRFELVDKNDLINPENKDESNVKKQEEVQARPDADLQHETVQNIDKRNNEVENEEEQANPKLLEFCEAETFAKKYELVKSFRGDLTDRMINDFAVVLDVVIPEGELDKRYEALLKCLQTFCKFEINRLR